MDENWIAWAAGIFEGEGSIYQVGREQSNGKYNTQIVLQVKMTDQDVVHKFQEVLDRRGNIYFENRTKPRYKDQWTWRCARRAQCVEIITLFWPYLGKRRKSKAIELGVDPLTIGGQ